jgi:hypothetical protein
MPMGRIIICDKDKLKVTFFHQWKKGFLESLAFVDSAPFWIRLGESDVEWIGKTVNLLTQKSRFIYFTIAELIMISI